MLALLALPAWGGAAGAGERLAPSPEPDVDPATACSPEVQCGCKGNNRTTYYVRYHKTGSTLSGQLVHDMSTLCAIDSASYDEWQGRATYDGSCHNVKLSLDPGNLNKYTREVLYELMRPGKGKRFVHMIREPLSLVAAFYAYNMTGKESGVSGDADDLSDPVFAEIFANVSQMPTRDGVRFISELVMAEQLPTMVYVKEQLSQTSGMPRADSLEMRLEDMIDGGVSQYDWRTRAWRTYDEMANRLAEFGGIPQPCVQEGTKLHTAFQLHQAGKWSDDLGAKAARAAGLARRSKASAALVQRPASGRGVLGSRAEIEQAGLMPGYQKEADALTALLAQSDLVQRLQTFGRALGYAYPDAVDEMQPLELEEEIPPSPPPAVKPMKESDCMRLLARRPDLIVMPEQRLIWCPTADTAIGSAVFALLGSGLASNTTRAAADKKASKLAQLAPTALPGFKLSSHLKLSEVHHLCSRGATSLAVVSDPWLRVVGVYARKVATGEDHPDNADVRMHLRAIRMFFGLEKGQRISFSQFVQWLSAQPNAGGFSVHWMPDSVRCDPEHVPYSLVGRQESLTQDLQRLVDALGWENAMVGKTSEPVSLLSKASLAACSADRACGATLTEQVGKDWARLAPSELARLMYASDGSHDLKALVSSIFEGDSEPFGYAFANFTATSFNSSRV